MTVEQVEAGLGRCDTDWNEDPHRDLSVIEVRILLGGETGWRGVQISYYSDGPPPR